MKIEFKYAQILPTKHPDFTVEVTFECEAEVDGEDVKLLNLWAHTHTSDKFGSTPWLVQPMPDTKTKEGDFFAGILKEKAREAAAKWKQDNF